MDEKMVISKLAQQIKEGKITLEDIPVGWREKVEALL